MKLSNLVKGYNCYFVGAGAGESFVMRLKRGCKFHWDYYWHCLDPKKRCNCKNVLLNTFTNAIPGNFVGFDVVQLVHRDWHK